MPAWETQNTIRRRVDAYLAPQCVSRLACEPREKLGITFRPPTDGPLGSRGWGPPVKKKRLWSRGLHAPAKGRRFRGRGWHPPAGGWRSALPGEASGRVRRVIAGAGGASNTVGARRRRAGAWCRWTACGALKKFLRFFIEPLKKPETRPICVCRSQRGDPPAPRHSSTPTIEIHEPGRGGYVQYHRSHR